MIFIGMLPNPDKLCLQPKMRHGNAFMIQQSTLMDKLKIMTVV